MSFVEKFVEDGWLRLGGVMPVPLIDNLRVEFERQADRLRSEQDGRRGYIRVGDGRQMLSVELTGPFLDPALYANLVLTRMLAALLGEDFLIDSFTCVVANPGAGEQKQHRDHLPLFNDSVAAALPPYAITVVVPLIDLDEQTGTTRLFPGTLHGGEGKAGVLPYVARGDCFMMDYRLLHHGTANRSGAIRPVLYIVYARPWFTDIGNFRRQPRINMREEQLRQVLPEHRFLFRRLAAPGAIDRSARMLFG